jgi:hypothetical protein
MMPQFEYPAMRRRRRRRCCLCSVGEKKQAKVVHERDPSRSSRVSQRASPSAGLLLVSKVVEDYCTQPTRWDSGGDPSLLTHTPSRVAVVIERLQVPHAGLQMAAGSLPMTDAGGMEPGLAALALRCRQDWRSCVLLLRRRPWYMFVYHEVVSGLEMECTASEYERISTSGCICSMFLTAHHGSIVLSSSCSADERRMKGPRLQYEYLGRARHHEIEI